MRGFLWYIIVNTTLYIEKLQLREEASSRTSTVGTVFIFIRPFK